MKFSKKLALLSLTTAGLIGIVGCKSVAKMPVNFVAVTSSDYNAVIQFGDYDYKFQGKIDQGSNNFKLVGTVAQRHNNAQSSQRMGPPASSTVVPDLVNLLQEKPAEQPGQGGGDPFGGGGDPFGGGGNPGGPGEGGDDPVAIESITLTLPKSEVFINEAIEPAVTFAPANVGRDDQGVTYTSSDEKIASVTDSGMISPNAVGTVTITATSQKDNTKTASAQLTVKEENLAQYNWSVNAEYEYQKGYGYVLTFEDEGKTQIHTDFDRTEGRHEFYYYVTIGQTSKTVKFQAKDPTFKDSLAKNYKKWDERDSSQIFYAKATGNNNSVATAYMYLHDSDHSVVINTPSGSERELKFGLSWEERGEGSNKTIVIKEGLQEYVADISINEQHPGYRLVYGGNAYYLSKNTEVKWKKMTTEDFDGETSYEFTGGYSAGMFGGQTEVNLNLGTDGVARLYIGSPAPTYKGTWSEDANTHKVTLTFGEHTCEFKDNDNGTKSIVVVLESTSMNMFTQKMETNTYNVEMNQVKPAQQ